MRGDVSFVASIIYAAIVIFAIAMIVAGVLSVFQPRSTFEKDAESFSRWVDTIGREDTPYTVSINKGEAFVLGYPNKCEEQFDRLDGFCGADRLCFCLARGGENGFEEVRCVESYTTIDVIGRSGGVCGSSHPTNFFAQLFDSEVEGIYLFTPTYDEDTQEYSIVVSLAT